MKNTKVLQAIIAAENERQDVYNELLNSGEYLPMETRRAILSRLEAKMSRLWSARRSEKAKRTQ